MYFDNTIHFTGISIYLILMLSSSFSNAIPDEKKLLKHLVTSYAQVGVDGKPLTADGQPIEVGIGFYLVRLLEVNQEERFIHLIANLYLEWKDPLLTWEPEDIGNVSVVNMDSSDIWVPKLNLLTDGLESQVILVDGGATVRPDGSVEWLIQQRLKTACDMTVGAKQPTCGIEFSAYPVSKEGLIITPMKDSVDASQYHSDPLWELLKTKVQKGDSTYPWSSTTTYSNVKVSLTLKKRKIKSEKDNENDSNNANSSKAVRCLLMFSFFVTFSFFL